MDTVQAQLLYGLLPSKLLKLFVNDRQRTIKTNG
jgi:hypothetical protein